MFYLFIGDKEGVLCAEINAGEKKVKRLLGQYNRKHTKYGIIKGRSWRSWIRFLKKKGLKVRRYGKLIEIYF
jgi:hypothetical protein